jgi:beta-aspartyl-dipeptidase (metallo-type)
MNQAQLIVNADIYAPEPLGIKHLFIAGGKILSLTDEPPTIDTKLNCQVIDADGQRLVPGFIDGHAHITGGGGESGPASQVPATHLSQFTRAGVTTVVGLLGTDDITRSTESLVSRARALCEEGITAYCHTGGYHLPPTTLTGSVSRDITFIDRVLGIGEIAISDHRSSQPGLDELLRLASETHVAGLLTGKAGILHLHLGDGKRGLELIFKALATSEIPARVFNPTHVNRQRTLFDEACELSKLGCTIDVTCFDGDEQSWSAAQALILYWQRELPASRITVSSDGGGCLPNFNDQGEITSMSFASAASLTDTFQELLASGQPLQKVLPPFTSNVADLLKLADKGRIGVGLDADLLLLDANNKLTDVMARGSWHIRDSKTLRFGMFEER